MARQMLLGDEAVALGAVHAGVTAAYAYPGTPSTEIVETLMRHARLHGSPRAVWTTNEKTAYEAALGVSFAGRRALVAMKHVGLNVAADAFINSALVALGGGLVLAVADDPGMHSSQNEQDTRFYADFARTICLEPASPQEAYEMTRAAFDLSERFRVPVVVRLVTRLAHSRGMVTPGALCAERPVRAAEDPESWTLLPGHARRLWRALLDRQPEIADDLARSDFNTLQLAGADLGVITCGVARNYYLENVDDLPGVPSHLHIGAYPLPVELVRMLVAHVASVLVLEEGQPFVERALRGLVRLRAAVRGKQSGALPSDGELTPDLVRLALDLPLRTSVSAPGLSLPARPPQLCAGCPHIDTFQAIEKAVSGLDVHVTSDIGCYTLGALPPYSAIHSCVCMGASIAMAKGAADAGLRPVLAVIGDSTFLHSGITPLIDAVAADTDMTVVIADNEVVAMTGGQPSALPSRRLPALLRGLGVDPGHLHVLDTHPRRVDANAAVLRAEIAHAGLSVVVLVRECVETLRARKAAAAEPS